MVPKSVVRHTFGLVRPRTGHFQDLLDRTMENLVRPGTDDVGPWSAKFVVGIITELGNTDLPNLIIWLQQLLMHLQTVRPKPSQLLFEVHK